MCYVVYRSAAGCRREVEGSRDKKGIWDLLYAIGDMKKRIFHSGDNNRTLWKKNRFTVIATHDTRITKESKPDRSL